MDELNIIAELFNFKITQNDNDGSYHLWDTHGNAPKQIYHRLLIGSIAEDLKTAIKHKLEYEGTE